MAELNKHDFFTYADNEHHYQISVDTMNNIVVIAVDDHPTDPRDRKAEPRYPVPTTLQPRNVVGWFAVYLTANSIVHVALNTDDPDHIKTTLLMNVATFLLISAGVWLYTLKLRRKYPQPRVPTKPLRHDTRCVVQLPDAVRDNRVAALLWAEHLRNALLNPDTRDELIDTIAQLCHYSHEQISYHPDHGHHVNTDGLSQLDPDTTRYYQQAQRDLHRLVRQSKATMPLTDQQHRRN